MFPVLQLGPLAIQIPGLILLLGLWLGLSLAERYAAVFGVVPGDLYNLFFLALISGLIGARLTYVLRYPSAFEASPASILSLNPSLLDITGGLAAAIVVSLIYGQRKRMKLLPTLDALTPVLAVLLIANSFAHYASGNAFGSPTELPWAIRLWGERRHPTQIYEILAFSLLLVVLWPGRKIVLLWPPGVYFLAFTASSAGIYLFLQAFRGDSPVLANGMRIPQIVAWIIMTVCLIAIGKLLKQSKEEGNIIIEPVEE